MAKIKNVPLKSYLKDWQIELNMNLKEEEDIEMKEKGFGNFKL